MKISLRIVMHRIHAALQGSSRITRGRAPGKHVKAYINHVLRVLFTLFAPFALILSVVFGTFFKDQPVRFTPFGILAPSAIFFGLLASGWFPRVPLWCIAILKHHGFLKHVKTCSPWHDNIVRDFSGEICILKSMDSHIYTSQELPLNLLRFLDTDQSSLGGGVDGADQQHSNEIDASTSGQDIVVQINTGDQRDRWVTFPGPQINMCPLEIQVFQSIPSFGDTFELSYTFRNERSENKLYLSEESFKNLVQNMSQWVENPFPIVIEDSTERSGGILHCMSIHDILWEFTKNLYTFSVEEVEGCYLGCVSEIRTVLATINVFIVSMLGLIPLVFQAQSKWFLLLIIYIVLHAYLSPTDGVIRDLTYYRFKSLLCPLLIKLYGFRSLYKSGSPFTWCNEFRKQRVVDPRWFLISPDYANRFLPLDRCFHVTGPVVALERPPSPSQTTPDSTGKVLHKYDIICQGWKLDPEDPQSQAEKQHECKLSVTFDDTINQDGTVIYRNVQLAFSEKDDLLDIKHYGCVEIKKLQLIQKVFSYYSDPTFGGYVDHTP